MIGQDVLETLCLEDLDIPTSKDVVNLPVLLKSAVGQRIGLAVGTSQMSCTIAEASPVDGADLVGVEIADE